jgi:hypothetical protein
MKYFCIIIIAVCSIFYRASAQESTPVNFIFTDIVYDAESIPNIGYEQFFLHKNKLRSWRVNLGYQIHYSDSFGVVSSHGDRISIGVYQGPAAKFAYTFYTPGHRNNWYKYYSCGLSLKYLWYNKEQVNTGKRRTDQSYRIQSENCMAAVPQFAIGAKRTRNRFCADFYIGLQFPIKNRDKTIYYDQGKNGILNLNVPYKTKQVIIEPGLLVGINIGLVKLKKLKAQ